MTERKLKSRKSTAKGPGPSQRELPREAAGAFQADAVAPESPGLYNEWVKIISGTSEVEVPAKDPRFADSAWREHPLYHRLGQAYLTFCKAVDSVADNRPEWRQRERARFLTGVLTSTMAPTNTLLGNPAALKRAFETGGMSVLRGMNNMLTDLLHNKGMPRQVNPSEFKVGGNLAMSPGAVVFRNEMVELLQYQPTSASVRSVPTLMIVPPIGKFYFMDLAPQRSFTEYAVSRGIQLFTTSWRNPTAQNAHWGLDDYVQTALEAVEAVCLITGSKKLNILGLCAGGIIATLMLNYMAARGDKRVNAAALGVTLLDFDAEAPIGAFHSKPVLKLARWRSATKGIMPAASLGNVFNWMRPNDLIWNYWSNNYLMGKEPPAFDLIAWGADGTNLPGTLHSQFLDIFEHNVLVKPGALKVLGETIDLKRIKVDTFVTGALTDHLTPWKACYRSAQLLGGRTVFVLSNAGHIASLVNPPGNPKSSYYTGAKPGPNPELWLQKATKHPGTWWDVWAEWTLTRNGTDRAAPGRLGNERYPPLIAAPGEYVMARA